MGSESDLADRLLRWQDLRDAGQPVTPEELCRDRPELCARLHEQIRILQNMERVLDGHGGKMPLPRTPRQVGPYEILGELGKGGMGVVYRARDRRDGRIVAVKTMRQADPAALKRFKAEFRALQEVHHPNLVTLFEVIADQDGWFFSMNLVEGVPFLDHIRGGASFDGPTSLYTTIEKMEQAPAGQPLTPGPLARLRDALGQLAAGLEALHAHGRTHRDIKPSNVLVTPLGQVILLDLGLSQLQGAGEPSVESAAAGTFAYMAPEQARGQPGPASDWYSVGLIVYEALTGTRPFRGSPAEILFARQESEPPPPSTVVANVPADLDALCVDLLRRRPEDRPTGPEVRARLAGAAPLLAAEQPVRPASSLFHGRHAHLAQLEEAFAAVRAGACRTVAVHGPSGAGKTALVQHFLDQHLGHAVILTGRCYEREAVPYKAIDGLIDSLASYWRRLPRHQAEALLPRDVSALARVFAVLRRVEAVVEAPHRGADAPDPQELRRRVFAALRELLGRLGDRTPIILHVDDLQWGDIDGAETLARLVRPPEPPRALLIVSYRREDASSACLHAWRQALDNAPSTEVAVDPLSFEEAVGLARALLGEEARARAEVVARESGGSPYFVHELARALSAPRSDAPTSLDGVIRARVATLPDNARRLLEVVAVAGRPLPRSVAGAASGSTAVVTEMVILLQSNRLLRGTGGDTSQIETYHDRVREAIVAALPGDRLSELHRRLAVVLEQAGSPDAEALADHWLAAGESRRAIPYLARAAARAAEALAFDRAADLFRRTLALDPPGVEKHRLQRGLADALASSGRSVEAGCAYLAAAEGGDTGETLDLQRRAAEQLLRGGALDEGMEVLGTVLTRVGMRLPATPRRAFWSLLWTRARLWLRGLRFHEQPASAVPADDLLRTDVCWSASLGLVLVDPIRGADFQARFALLALRCGEPVRVALALATTAAQSAIRGIDGGWLDSLLEQAIALARRTGSPYAQAMTTLMGASIDLLLGRWRSCRERAERAEEQLRSQCTGVAWELGTVQVFWLYVQIMLGELALLRRHLPSLLQEALERGDRYTLTNLRLMTYLPHLMDDHPDLARDAALTALRDWPVEGFHYQHYRQMLAVVSASLYRGAGADALAELDRCAPLLRHHHFLRTADTRAQYFRLRIASALTAAGPHLSHKERGRLLSSAQCDLVQLERLSVGWVRAVAQAFRAALAAHTGQASAAAALLDRAEQRFAQLDMHLFAASARRQRGQLVGGAAGAVLCQEADLCLSRQGVCHPARMAHLFIAGFPMQESAGAENPAIRS